MQIRAPLILSLILIAAMCAISLYFGQTLPPNVQIATHFTLNGTPDGWMPRQQVLLHAPLLAAMLTLLMAVLPRLFRRSGVEKSAEAYVVAWMGIVSLIFVVHCLILMHARDHHVDVAGTAQLIVAVIFILLGNFMGRTRRNRFVGVRTPWTLKSDYAWQKTNRLDGYFMVIWGLVWAGEILFFPQFSPLPLIAPAAAMVLVLYPASRYYANHDPESKLLQAQ